MNDILQRGLRSTAAQVIIYLSLAAIPWMMGAITWFGTHYLDNQQKALEAVIRQSGANAGQINVLTAAQQTLKGEDTRIDRRVDRLEDRVNIISGRGEVDPPIMPHIPGEPR